MKIFFLVHTLTSGGAERVTSSLANHWAGAGNEVGIITMGLEEDFYPILPQVTRHRFDLSKPSPSLIAAFRGAFRRIRAIRRLLRKERPDAVIAMMTSWNIELALAAWGLPVRAIGSERIHPPTLPLSRPWQILRKRAYGLLDIVVAQTEKSGKWVRDNTNAREVRVIPNPVSALRQAPPAATDGLPREAPLLLGVGRLVGQKRFDRLISALADARIPQEWHLAIVGEGPLREVLAQQAAALGISDRVHFPGRTALVEGWYARAQAFALCSDFEGFPNALIEAMTSGLACVAVDCDTGPADLIRHGDNGFLVAQGDQEALTEAVARLATDAQLRARLGDAARVVAEQYSADAIAARWEALFTARTA